MSFCYNNLCRANNGYRVATGGAGGTFIGRIVLSSKTSVKLVAGKMGAPAHGGTAGTGGTSYIEIAGVREIEAYGGTGGYSDSGPTVGTGGTAKLVNGAHSSTTTIAKGNNGDSRSHNHSGQGWPNGALVNGTIPAVIPRTTIGGNWSMTFTPGCSACSYGSNGVARQVAQHTPSNIGGVVLLTKVA